MDYNPLKSNDAMLKKLDDLLPTLKSALSDIRYHSKTFLESLEAWRPGPERHTWLSSPSEKKP
jgi:hypothetical protein